MWLFASYNNIAELFNHPEIDMFENSKKIKTNNTIFLLIVKKAISIKRLIFFRNA